MLTVVVNIAVFAAFQFCDGCSLLSDAEFKSLRMPWQLDIACYGRQKRQDVARSGKVGGKNGNIVSVSGRIHATTRAAAGGMRWVDVPRYAVVQVLAAPGGVEAIELNYHEERGLSRR